MNITEIDINLLNSQRGLKHLLKSKKIKLQKSLNFLNYEEELKELQIELIKLQNWIVTNKNVWLCFLKDEIVQEKVEPSGDL